MNIINDIKHSFKQANIAEKLIYINISVFVVSLFAGKYLNQWFALNSNFELLITHPWSLFSYGFLHANFPHILFNMIFIYYIGNLFLNFFTPKQFLNYFILGTIVGGLAFLLINSKGYLVGASAGIMAVLVGIATKIPNYEIRLRLIGNVKLWIIALFYIIISLAGLDGLNSGGNIAHLGGALLGFIYTKQLEKGIDIGSWLETGLNAIVNIFKPTKKSTLKTVHKKSTIKRKPTNTEITDKQRKIDRILDKISKSGYDSLSKEEKDFLFKSGK